MVIKKYQGKTETEAILLAKEELGKDAIVMNIKTIKPKGIYKLFKKLVVEVTAAVDDNISYNGDKKMEKSEEPSNIYSSVKKTYESTIHKAQSENTIKEGSKDRLKEDFKDIIKEDLISDTQKKETSAIEEKLNSLQNLLEKQMSMKQEETRDENKNSNKNETCINLIYNQLLSNEVDEKYANQIIGEIEKNLNKDVSVDNILASVYQKIVLKLGQAKSIEPIPGKVKFVYFIGPTGVGKTTTIAKIASSFKLYKKAKVALITSDTYRIAAVDQLRTYANILEIPIKVVYSWEDMEEAKSTFADYDIVLVDTAGRSHRNKEQRDDIELLINAVEEESKDVYLVLSATTKYTDLIKIAQTYKEITNYKLIFTKLDETSSVGNILNLKMMTSAPLSYATWGQNVPDDIGQINPQIIAKQLLGGK